MSIQQQIDVMQMASIGKPIEFRGLSNRGSGSWISNPDPKWNWESFEYRVKPEPREFWVNIYDRDAIDNIAHLSKENADRAAGAARVKCILVREVIE